MLAKRNKKTMKTFVLSDSSITNSHGFRIELDGMDLSRFDRNPVMLYNHNHEQVIGRWKNLRIEEDRLLADAEFDTDDKTGAEVARKVERGYLRGCSVGIYIKQMNEYEHGFVATKTELLEASIVSVPSDAGAVLLYDENNEPTTFDKVKLSFLNFNKQKINNMKEKQLFTPGIAEMLGISQEATVEELEQALCAQKQHIDELENQIECLQKAKVEELIDRAVVEHRISSDERETYMSLAEKDFDAVQRIIARQPKVESVASQLNIVGSEAKYDGKSWDELDRAGLLASLRAENPERYKQLYNEKFNVKL